MVSKPTLPTGVGVALVTMFNARGEVDAAATTERAVRCVERGMSSILAAGTTGEAWRLSADDRLAIATAIKDALPATPLFVGTGDREAKRALELTTAVAEAKVADAVAVLCPGDMPARSFYDAAREAAPEAVLLAYHFPSVSPPGIPVGDVGSLPVDGIKDSSGDADRLAELIEDGVHTYVGSPNLVTLAGGCGATGALLALGNTVPELCRAAWSGDMDAQRQLFARHRASMADFPASLK
jgi:4-hydroxy-tetrahydrodipicolinate synthase